MNGSYSYGQGGGYHYNPNPKRPRRDGDWGDWLGIVVLLFLPLGITQVIAVVWLVSKLRNMTRQQAQNYAFQARQAAEFVKGFPKRILPVRKFRGRNSRPVRL